MMRYMPLSDWPAAAVPVDPPLDKLDDIAWLPIADSEFLLCAHYYPLCLRLDGPAPRLGIVLASSYLSRPLVKRGRWAGAYTPIALRCFPFRLGRPPGGDPLAELEVTPVMPAAEKPRLLRLKDQGDKPSKDLLSIYEGLGNVATSQHKWQSAIHLLQVADLLVSVPPAGGRDAPAIELFTIARHRLAQLSRHAIGALGRHEFAALDLATSMTYSQVHLRQELRPVAPIVAADGPSAGADLGTGGIDMITPWLDTSELFPGAWAADPAIWRGEPGDLSEPRALAGASASAPASTAPRD